MTNWCQNRLEVHGNDRLLMAWRTAQWGPSPDYGPQIQHLSFHAQVPVPQEVMARGYGTGGLPEFQRAIQIQTGQQDPTPHLPLDRAAWQTAYWGSSRDASDVTFTEGPGQLVFSFATAWAPPVPWLETVAALWPALSFELSSIEPGNDLYVHMRLETGSIVSFDERAPTLQDLQDWGYDSDKEFDPAAISTS